MKVSITSQRKVYLNDQMLTDVVWADPESGQTELFEHTCSRLSPPERIPDPDNPTSFRTLVVQGSIRIEEIPYPAPSAPSPETCSNEWGAAGCYLCAMNGLSGCCCGRLIP